MGYKLTRFSIQSILLLCLLFVTATTQAQVGISQAVTQAGTASTTWSLQCSGTSPEVVVLVHYTGFTSVSAKYNNKTFNGVTNASSNSDNVALFYFNSPATGLNDVELDVSGTGTYYADALALTNADDNSISITVLSTSSGNSATVTQPGSSTGDLILGGVMGNLGTITVPASATHQITLLNPFTSPYDAADGYIAATNGDQLTWDFSKSSNNTIWATRIRGSVGLPIKLLSFGANYSVQTNSVILNWSTATEVNNKLFTVEKTSDGVSFEEVTTLPGADNSDQPLNYTATDETPSAGTTYYRLKQTDYDGNYTYSDLAPVTIAADYKITLAPNPVGNMATLHYTANNTAPLNVRIYDMAGQVVNEYSFNSIQEGENMLSVNTSLLAQGTYIMQLNNGLTSTSRKFIK